MNKKPLIFAIIVIVLVVGFFYVNPEQYSTVLVIMKNWNWGSVSDWVSSIATLITTLIAYKAYRAAPKWFSQKSNEEGFKHVTSLLTDYDKIATQVANLHHDILIANTQSNTQLPEKIRVLIEQCLSLESRLEASRRWGVILKPNVQSIFERPKRYFDSAYKLMTFERQDNPDHWDSEVGKLEQYKADIKRNSQLLNDNKMNYFKFPE